MVLMLPEPAISPGLTVQFPAGRPLNTTLPVESAHEGWVMVPAIGAEGVVGCAFTVSDVEGEIQVGDAINLALTIWFPDKTAAKVVLVWYVPASS